MKKLLALVIALHSLQNCYSQNIDYTQTYGYAMSNIKSHDSEENIKSIKGSLYLAIEKFGDVEKGELIYDYQEEYNTEKQSLEYKTYTYSVFANGKEHKRYLYDDRGNKIEENSYYINNFEFPTEKLLSKTKYKYDSNNNLIDDSNYNSDGSLRLKTTYRYNENDKEIEKKSNWVSNSDINTITTKYDSNNIVEISSDGESYYSKNKIYFEYDERNNIISKKCLSTTDGISFYSYTKKYDNQNNNIEFNSFDQKGIIESKTTYKYDESKNVIEEKKYKSGGVLSSTKTYIYDENNNISENNLDGERSIYTYDLAGNNIESKYYNKYGSLKSMSSRSFEYDSKGNWIKRIDFKNEKAILVYERELVYF